MIAQHTGGETEGERRRRGDGALRVISWVLPHAVHVALRAALLRGTRGLSYVFGAAAMTINLVAGLTQ